MTTIKCQRRIFTTAITLKVHRAGIGGISMRKAHVRSGRNLVEATWNRNKMISIHYTMEECSALDEAEYRLGAIKRLVGNMHG